MWPRNSAIKRTRQPLRSQEGIMARPDFPLSIDRRRLLASATAVTASGIVPSARPAKSAARPFVQLPQVTSEAGPANVSAATAGRLLEITRRNELRREANLPLLSIAQELRRMKDQETRGEFKRFEAAYARAVWEKVLKPRREAEGNPNWRPNWMEGVSYQTQVRKILWEQFTQYQDAECKFRGGGRPDNRRPLSEYFNGHIAEESYRANGCYQRES
jgi:hypothetical protein